MFTCTRLSDRPFRQIHSLHYHKVVKHFKTTRMEHLVSHVNNLTTLDVPPLNLLEHE